MSSVGVLVLSVSLFFVLIARKYCKTIRREKERRCKKESAEYSLSLCHDLSPVWSSLSVSPPSLSFSLCLSLTPAGQRYIRVSKKPLSETERDVRETETRISGSDRETWVPSFLSLSPLGLPLSASLSALRQVFRLGLHPRGGETLRYLGGVARECAALRFFDLSETESDVCVTEKHR